jgi:hypothetical protein
MVGRARTRADVHHADEVPAEVERKPNCHRRGRIGGGTLGQHNKYADGAVHLGFGRIVVSETEVPNMSAIPV